MSSPDLFSQSPPTPTEPADSVAALAALGEEARECRRCHLAETRTQVVFGEGNPTAPLVFVGEGPGETEDATGRPFVGRAGKLLDELLRAVGMTREHVYICNTVKCRAADRAGNRWRNRPPTTEEIAACRHWLDLQLQTIAPLVIVCVGAPAAKTLIKPSFAITRERGQWFTHSPYAPWITAILHPAYLLRLHGPNGDAARKQSIADIEAARRKVIEARREQRQTAAPAQPTQGTLFEL